MHKPPKQAQTVNIVCIKWGTKYGASSVNQLYHMVQSHLSRPYRFLCFTDDPAGIASPVEVRPLPQVSFPPGPERGWNKLGILDQKQTGLQGTTLFLDLDVVVMDAIDCFIDLPGEFCIIRDWLRGGRKVGNSSSMAARGRFEPIWSKSSANLKTASWSSSV